MKKFFLVLLVVLFGAALAACDSKKGDGGGGEPNTPIADGNYATYLGNYNVESIVATNSATPYSTSDKKQITDFLGKMVIDSADASNIHIKGSLQVGGNTFIEDAIGVSAISTVNAFDVTQATTTATINPAEQTISFNSNFNSTDYAIVMKKVSDNSAIDTLAELKKIWSETGLCYQPEGEGLTEYSNCVVGTEAGQSGTDRTQVNQASSALKLIGNYYLSSIKIVGAGTTTCTANQTIDIQNNGLVGELSAKAGLGGSAVVDGKTRLLVNLDIALKFQFENAPEGCNFAAFQQYEFKDQIPVDTNPNSIDFAGVFSQEGLTIIGTETITYKPQKRDIDFGPLSDREVGGALIELTFKKAKDGVLGADYAKPLVEERYY